MKIASESIFFCVLAILWIACASPSKNDSPGEEYSTLRLYGTAIPDQTGRHQIVSIYRRTPVTLSIASQPFLDEGHVLEAKIIETIGGFSLRIQFDKRGKGLLENASHQMRNQAIAIHSYFPESRWLAAPVIDAPIGDGVLIFTPDANREEAERIVKGLNALSKKLRKGS